jgi:ribosomal protein L11 methyltransferase
VAWLRITLELEQALAEAVSEALIEEGAQSVALEDAAPGERRSRLEALAALDADPGALVAAAARACGLARVPEFRVARLEDEDWVRRAQAQFAPIRIAERLWIVPSWHPGPEPGASVVRLDPGLAFGTGSHASTRLVLAWLARSLRGGERVLDYGCGSGILAIAAAKLGAREACAVDLDPRALEAAAANARANGVALRAAAPEELPAGDYDVVVANILAAPLIVLQPLLAARVRPGGAIALSGILEAQAPEVVAAYARDFEAAVAAAEEGWALIAGRRRAAPEA